MNLKISKDEYAQLVEKVSPVARLRKTIPGSFLIGGLICAFGEILRFGFLALKLSKEDAGNWTSFILILITAILTGTGLFHKIAKYAGAGTFVPITGFANSVISPALEFKTEGFIAGVSTKMFIIAGPVIVYGVTASIASGFIFYIAKLLGGNL